MAIQDQLIGMLQDCITENRRILNNYYNIQDKYFGKMLEVEAKLSKNINDIISVDFTLIRDFVFNFSMSEAEQEKMLEELKVIIRLLQLNRDNGTTLKLSPLQENLLQQFLDELRNNITSKKSNLEELNVDVLEVEKATKKYKRLLKSLSNPKNVNMITDIDLLRGLFLEKGLTEEEMNMMYRFILGYNQKIYDFRIGNCNMKQLQSMGKSDIDKLKKTFQGFGYDFDILPPFLQDAILEKATLNNIRKVFKSLKKNGYQLDLERDNYLLASLLIDSNDVVIDKMSQLAFSKGLTQEQVLKIGSVLIPSPKGISKGNFYDRFHIIDTSSQGLMVFGSARDFEKNIKTLGAWGLSVKYVYDRLPSILVCSNEVLSHNLSLFQDYGFSIRCRSTKICHSTFSALLHYNTAEVIDRFIEVHPLGLEYLRRNLSVLREVNSIDDLIFYKLYYSNKYCGSEEAFIRIINNKDSMLAFQGIVSGLSSLYIDSYKDINDKNKYEITGTFKPVYRLDYQLLIKNKIGREIEASIFDNPYVQHINMYSDPREPLLYNFDGIRISKMKVLRVVDALLRSRVAIDDDSFLFALLYNTIISRDEFDKIKGMIQLEGQVV